MSNLLETYRDGLLDDVLPFWLRHGLDADHGGYITSVDRDGTILDTDKGMWQQGRFAWLLSHLYATVEEKQEWLAAAQSGVEFIRQHGFDDDGRAWFHVTQDGRPLRKRRYLFTECFFIMAFAEYSRATNCGKSRDDAIQLFNRYLQWKGDIEVLPPKFTETRPLKAIGTPMIEIGVYQTMRDAFDTTEFDTMIDRCIEEIEAAFVKPELAAVMETVDLQGGVVNHFDGRLLNPGHAIEASWFIMEEGRRRRRDDYLQLGARMLDYMWARGWDEEHGGIFYFRDIDGLPVQEYWHDMKFWWPHNETIIATLLAAKTVGDEKYSGWHRQVHDWAHQHFPDDEHGEWFGYLHRDGTPSVHLKGNLWKGPFHLPRMQKVCWDLLR